jgi:hypothetical protein
MDKLLYQCNLGLLLMANLSGFRHIGRLAINICFNLALSQRVEAWKPTY